MKVIVSDLEGTLTTGSSWKALGTYFKTNFNPGEYNRFFLSWIPRYLLVKLGILSRKEVMFQWMQEEIVLFRGLSRCDFRKMAEWVIENEMWPKRRKTVLDELNAHQRNGAQIVISSSAYQPVVDAFAQYIDAEAIGSKLVFSQDKLTGVALPLNSYEHKADYIRNLFDTGEILVAYGDTTSDIPMMEMSRWPVAVCPHIDLRHVAEARGWRIIDG